MAAFLVLFAVFAVAAQIILMVVLRIVGALVGRTKTTLDDRILGAVSAYLPAVALVTSLLISIQAVYPDRLVLGNMKEMDLYAVLMLGIVGLMLASIADAFLIWYGIEIRPRKTKVNEREIFPFVRNVVKIIIVVVFVIFILQRFGFDTTAIITGLGVGGLAVALALQDTLGNFFAGVHIMVDKPFREDDYIRLESGLEGTVKQIGWRTTRLLTPSQNEIIVPNSKLAGSILENFSTPNEIVGLAYSIGVDYREDIEAVEKVIGDALHNVAMKNKAIDEKSLWVRFDSFGDYSLNFKYGYMVRGYANRFDALKDVNRELFYSFKKNSINIPFPVRVIYNQPAEQQAGPEKAKKR